MRQDPPALLYGCVGTLKYMEGVMRLACMWFKVGHRISQSDEENSRSSNGVGQSDADTTCLRHRIQHFLYILIRSAAVKVDICVFGDMLATAAIHEERRRKRSQRGSK